MTNYKGIWGATGGKRRAALRQDAVAVAGMQAWHNEKVRAPARLPALRPFLRIKYRAPCASRYLG